MTKEEILNILEQCQAIVNRAARSGKLKGITFLDDKSFVDTEATGLVETAEELHRLIHPERTWLIQNKTTKQYLSQLLPDNNQVWSDVESEAIGRPKKAQAKLLIQALGLEKCRAVSCKR